MQPEILDTPQPDNHSEPTSAPAVTQYPSVAVPDHVHSEATAKVEKKRPRIRLAAVALVVFSFLLIAGVSWVGYWAYQLSVDLTATQQQLLTLQADHEKLQADYAALTSDNARLSEDLTKAQSDLTTAQADLEKLKDANQSLNTRLKKASALAEVLNSFFKLDEFSGFVELDTQVKAAHDPQLTRLWDEFAASPGEDSLGEFLVYLVPAIQDALK